MRVLFVLSFCLVGLAAATSACRANNNLFLPGDAFFPTVLTKADIDGLQSKKAGERTFAYSSLGGYEGAFCGYAGYANATFASIDDAFARNLASVYQRIREVRPRRLEERTFDGKTQLVETNGIQVLLYPAAFEFPRHALGLRYNENWVAECVKFGHRREHLRLCSLISEPEAVATSWRDADLVQELKVKLPGVKPEPGTSTEAPVLVEGPIKAFVLESHSLKQLFRPEDNEGATVYVVTSTGVTCLVYHAGDWKPFDLK
jgi:hypothetical protein